MRRAPTRLRILPIVAFALALAALPGQARADDKQTAKDLFEQGLSKMEAKRYDEACPAIEKSLTLDPYPGTLFTLAECEALRGHAASALRRYDEYLALYATLPKAKQIKQGTREKEARAKKADLERTVARVTLTLPAGAPSGVTVTNDGAPVPAERLGAEILFDPGDHVISVQAPGAPASEQRVTLSKGEKREIVLELRAPAKASAPTATASATAPPPVTEGPSGQRIAAYVTGGLGVAGLIAGGVTGGLMLAQKGAIDAGCTDAGDGVAVCDAKGVAAGNDAKMFGTIATVGLIAGVASAGVAVVLFVTDKKKPKAGATTGAFTIGVEPRGLGGATLGVRGSF